ncbi:bifunctional 2-polyprenyl-6-hydroxyphenol methylase/3-demethylubiquinol 3-O-methyltransferase UbiG [Paenibacillus sp. XY044]|uniref:class I SAM-dependent methyltransferase n=1 Tax=Paenibacillus sp. XY044 TaxID=2026089 RepID=UPI0015C63707|nr:class I SAM-dependent methyltransferase [Paenibacillus sp. XY044]
MESYDWDEKMGYLRRRMNLYYNDDYIAFLVKSVWKWETPVRIVDFGCGFGQLGLMMLPHLPEGSTYTGIDPGGRQIAAAKELYAHLPWKAEFIQADLEEADPGCAFDVAVSHAVLMHRSNPLQLLAKMAGCVKDGGTVICYEPHGCASMASYYFADVLSTEVMPLGPLQKLHEQDALRTGKDANIGMKLPIYFSQLGLRQIESRISDKVNYYDPAQDSEETRDLFGNMLFECPGPEEDSIQALSERGLTSGEAEQLYLAEDLLSQIYTPSIAFAHAPSMKITFGTVVR